MGFLLFSNEFFFVSFCRLAFETSRQADGHSPKPVRIVDELGRSRTEVGKTFQWQSFDRTFNR
jgi:hypothetical protein